MITYEDKVALNENADIADINKVTAGDMNQIKQVVNSLANLFFPIKKIVIFNDNNDYSNYLGFTWERIASGKVLVGYDTTDSDFDTIGKTGGEKKHTLTIDEMPSHRHNENYGNEEWVDDSGTGSRAFGNTVTYSQSKTAKINVTSTVGGNQPHNNLQPYQVVAYWQRVS